MLFADAQLAILDLGLRVPNDLQLAVLTNRGVSPPIRLNALAFEIDPADPAGAQAEMIMQRVRGERPNPAHLVMPFGEVIVTEEVNHDGTAREAAPEVVGQAVNGTTGVSRASALRMSETCPRRKSVRGAGPDRRHGPSGWTLKRKRTRVLPVSAA